MCRCGSTKQVVNLQIAFTIQTAYFSFAVTYQRERILHDPDQYPLHSVAQHQ